MGGGRCHQGAAPRPSGGGGSAGGRRTGAGRLELFGAHEREDEIGEEPEGDGGAEDEIQHGSGLRGPAGIARHDTEEADADEEIDDVHGVRSLDFGPATDTQSRVSSRYGIQARGIRNA